MTYGHPLEPVSADQPSASELAARIQVLERRLVRSEAQLRTRATVIRRLRSELQLARADFDRLRNSRSYKLVTGIRRTAQIARPRALIDAARRRLIRVRDALSKSSPTRAGGAP
jgi:hypothetical protein